MTYADDRAAYVLKDAGGRECLNLVKVLEEQFLAMEKAEKIGPANKYFKKAILKDIGGLETKDISPAVRADILLNTIKFPPMSTESGRHVSRSNPSYFKQENCREVTILGWRFTIDARSGKDELILRDPDVSDVVPLRSAWADLRVLREVRYKLLKPGVLDVTSTLENLAGGIFETCRGDSIFAKYTVQYIERWNDGVNEPIEKSDRLLEHFMHAPLRMLAEIAKGSTSIAPNGCLITETIQKIGSCSGCYGDTKAPNSDSRESDRLTGKRIKNAF